MNGLYNEFLECLKWVGIYDEDFLMFLEGKVHRFPTSNGDLGWGTFPKLDSQQRIIDIRILAPIISDERTLLINVHEYTHAYDWYQMLNQVDDTSKDVEFETRASDAEKLVLEKRKNRKNSC